MSIRSRLDKLERQSPVRPRPAILRLFREDGTCDPPEEEVQAPLAEMENEVYPPHLTRLVKVFMVNSPREQ